MLLLNGRTLPGSLLIATALSLGAASASAASLDVRLPVVVWGVTMGQADHRIEVDGARYAVKGRAKSRGVAAISGGKASYATSGSIAGDRLLPDSHRLSFKARKKGRLALDFRDGDVVRASVKPRRRPKKDRVKLTAGHRRDVVDPVSAMMFAVAPGDVGKGARVCNRTIPYFDGNNRADLVLSHKGTRQAKADGFAGPVHTCSVRFRPLAGHRPSKAVTKFYKANRQMEITVARVGETPVYALFGFSVKMQRGTASGQATRFRLK